MRDVWTLEDGRHKLNDIVEALNGGNPQYIEDDGKKVAVLITPLGYDILKKIARKTPGLINLFNEPYPED